MMAPRYLFICPNLTAPSGGIAVLYDCVSILRQAGYDAFVVHEGPGIRYPLYPEDVPILYTLKTRQNRIGRIGMRARPGYGAAILRDRITGAKDRMVHLTERDVLVAPEFMLTDVIDSFPGQPKIVLSQNSFAYLDSVYTLNRFGLDCDDGVIANIGISRSCLEAFDLVGGRAPHYVPVSPNLSLFDFRETKSAKIAYMPRKRPEEAVLIDRALRQRGRIGQFDLCRIDGMPQPEVAAHLGDSLIFISLMKAEALGFPAIEAMASGCIVVGYTGFGTEEYFDETTGFPITEGDTAGLVKTVEAVVAEYAADPTRLDAMRRRASEVVRTRYNPQRFRQALLKTWDAISSNTQGGQG